MIANRTLDIKSVANKLNNVTILTSPTLAKVCCAIGILQLTRPRGVSYCLKGCPKMPSRLTLSALELRNEMFAQGKLWCSRCGKFQPIGDFNAYPSKPRANYGYRHYCWQVEKVHYFEKRELINQRINSRNANLKARFVEYAGGKCQRCGYNEFNSALEFHHVYGSQKECSPTKIIYSNDFPNTWVELDKCCLLCANCHASYTGSEWRAEFIKRAGLGWTVGTELPLNDKRYETIVPPVYSPAPMPEISVDFDKDNICPVCTEYIKPKLSDMCSRCKNRIATDVTSRNIQPEQAALFAEAA